MANFYVSLSNNSIAKQIATLLNTHNLLYKQHNEYTIQHNAANYFVELNQDEVIGCVASIPEYGGVLGKIFHICVNPKYRRRGIAQKLIRLAMQNCNTDYVYMTIRDDNVASLYMAKKLGFVFVNKYWSKNHYVITVGRRK